MATEVGSAYVTILPKLEKFGSVLSKGVVAAGSAAGKAGGLVFGKSFAKFGAIAGVAGAMASKAVNAVTSSLDNAIARVDTMNNFPLVMQNMGISAEESAAAIQMISDGINGLPTSLDSATMSVQRFASMNGDVEKSAEMFLAVNDAILAGGANSQLQASALEQLSQAYSKGRMDMMEWRTLQMAMPAQLNQVAQAMGVTTDELGEGLREGTIAMDDFVNTIMRLDKEGVDGFASFQEQAQAATGGIGTALTNVQNRISKALATIIDAIGQTNISGAINAFSSSFSTMAQPIVNFIEGFKSSLNLEQFTPMFERFANALGIVADKAASMGTSIGTVAGGAFQTFLEVTSSLSTMFEERVLPAILMLQPAFESLGNVFSAITTPIGEFVSGNGEAFNSMMERMSEHLTDAQQLMIPFGEALQHIAEVMQPIADVIGPAIAEFLGTLASAIVGLLPALLMLATFFGEVFATIVGTVQSVIETVIAAWESAKQTTAEVWGQIKTNIVDPITSARDTVSGIVDEIFGFFNGLGGRISSAIGSIHFPQPHITWESLTIGDSKTPISIPHVTWAATGGYIVNGATIIGAGEAGAEAIIPLTNETYMKPFAKALTDQMGGKSEVYNVYIDGARLFNSDEIRNETRAYMQHLMRLAAI